MFILLLSLDLNHGVVLVISSLWESSGLQKQATKSFCLQRKVLMWTASRAPKRNVDLACHERPSMPDSNFFAQVRNIKLWIELNRKLAGSSGHCGRMASRRDTTPLMSELKDSVCGACLFNLTIWQGGFHEVPVRHASIKTAIDRGDVVEWGKGTRLHGGKSFYTPMV